MAPSAQQIAALGVGCNQCVDGLDCVKGQMAGNTPRNRLHSPGAAQVQQLLDRLLSAAKNPFRSSHPSKSQSCMAIQVG